jgi:hypothetical protein
VTYSPKDLLGVWVFLEDDSRLTIEEDGSFELTPTGADGSMTVGRWVLAISAMRGRWLLEDDGKLMLRVDPRSMRLSSTSRIASAGIALFSFLTRFVKEKEIVHGTITRLTAADLWVEGSQGKIDKLRRY